MHFDGLRPPAPVQTASQAYRQDNDVIGEFLDDRCELAPDAVVAAGSLWSEYCRRRYVSRCGRMRT
jgi:phage/plasmid-associated DNA primase